MSLRAVTGAVTLVLLFHATDLPAVLIDVLDLHIPRRWDDIPYTMPFVGICALMLFEIQRRRKAASALNAHDGLFAVVMLIWTVIELLHFQGGAPLRHMLVQQQIQFFVTYFTVRTFLMEFDTKRTFVLSVQRFCTGLLLVHVALLLCHRFNIALPGLNVNEIVERNGLSYLGILTLYLRWFHERGPSSTAEALRTWTPWIVVAQIYLNQARGAALVLCMLVGIFWLSHLRINPKWTVSGIALLLLLLTGTTMFGYSIMTTTGLWPKLDPDAQGNAMQNELLDSAFADAQKSSIYRLSTNAHVEHLLLQSPLLGHGADLVSKVRIGGYGSHTYYLILAASYGLLGLSCYVTWLAIFFGRLARGALVNRVTAAAFLWASMAFSNDMLPWYGCLLGILWSTSNSTFRAGNLRLNAYASEYGRG